MRFSFDEEQEALRRQARRFCDEHASSAATRRAMETGDGFVPETWTQLVQLGWPALLIPEALGGAGLGMIELAAICEETGASLLCAPLFSTLCLATPLLLLGGDAQQQQAWLPRLAAGELRATLALADATPTRARRDADGFILDGEKAFVVDGHTSDVMIVAAREGEKPSLFIVPAASDGLVRRPRATLDATRKLADVSLRGVRVPATARLAGDVLERGLDRARVALAAEQLGAAQRCLDMSVEYAKTRVQFGRAIGSFQAVKHRLANLLMRVESARSAVYWAAWCAAVDDAEAAVAAPLAHAVATETYLQAASDAIQVHGGIGFTWEHDAHLHLKRARASAMLLGDATAERARLAQVILPEPPVSAATIPELVHAVAEHGDRVAVSDGAEIISYASLTNAVAECARAWMALGIARGDRVAIWAPNSWRWQLAALGAHSAGAVIVPLNTRWKGREVADVLARSRARALVTVTGFLGCDYVAALRAAEIALPQLESIVVADGVAPAGTLAWRAFLDGGAAISPADAARRAREVTPDDYSDLVFTAGTTGTPKGVAMTHAQSLRTFATWSEIVGLRADDRYLVVNPYFHTFGYKAGWLACLLSGATCLPQAVFSVDEVLARVARDRVTVLPGPPTLYQSILAHTERAKYDLSSLRLAVTGAAIVPLELIRRMRRELTFKTVLTAYGLTEACGTVTMCRRDDDDEVIARTSGRAIPGCEVRVDANGEIRARGFNVMRGYWEDDTPAVDSDGWLHTGDVGTLDDAGNLRITDRLKDLYIVGGFNVSPAEVEQLLHAHPAVAQAAVVGAPDERLGEVGYAFVVARPNQALTANALIDWTRERLANYKVPRHVELVDALPLSAVGKVLKTELRVRAKRALRAS